MIWYVVAAIICFALIPKFDFSNVMVFFENTHTLGHPNKIIRIFIGLTKALGYHCPQRSKRRERDTEIDFACAAFTTKQGSVEFT